MKGEWFVVVNPNAGNGKGKKDWKQISALLDNAGLRHTNIVTEHQGHAIKLVRRYIDMGFSRIIVVGGDGTLNEAVNAILTQRKFYSHEIELAMIPIGTGNDWVRTHNIPTDYTKAIEVIKAGKIVKHDAGKVLYVRDGLQQTRYFINIVGMGFDAEVALKVNLQKPSSRSSEMGYFYHIFTTLLQHANSQVKLMLDDKIMNKEVFTMAAGICKYNGGGMKQLPNALFNDGLLDVMIIGKVSKSRIILNVKKLFDGSFIEMKEVETFTCKTLIVESEPLFGMEADGESISPSRFEIQVLPAALSVVVP
jgi:YegS/Rv2252/BmrU family lipid kinase